MDAVVPSRRSLAVFFCSGLAISLLLTRGSKEINRLYGYDLLGAGIGCGAVALVIPRFGGSGSIFVAAFAGALSAMCFAWRSWRVLTTVAAVVSAVLLAASFYAEKVVPIHISANKSRRSINAIYSAWNALSLVQVVEFPAQGKDPAQRVMFIDSGTAATGMNDLRPDVRAFLAWGVNGFFTVTGTVLALMLGMMIGFRMVLLLACVSYLFGLMAMLRVSKIETRGPAAVSDSPAVA